MPRRTALCFTLLLASALCLASPALAQSEDDRDGRAGADAGSSGGELAPSGAPDNASGQSDGSGAAPGESEGSGDIASQQAGVLSGSGSGAPPSQGEAGQGEPVSGAQGAPTGEGTSAATEPTEGGGHGPEHGTSGQASEQPAHPCAYGAGQGAPCHHGAGGGAGGTTAVEGSSERRGHGEGRHHYWRWGRCVLEELGETDPLFSMSRGPFTLGIIGSVELLAVPFVQDPMASIEAGSIANAEGFRLRRARFGFEGDLGLRFSYRFQLQHSEGEGGILDAWISWEPHPLARMTAGALKVPFSESMIRSSEYQTFLQRPYAVREIAPDRALGFQIAGQWRYLSYAVGVFNGGGDFYRGDNNAGMLYAARLAVHPFGPPVEGEVTQPDGVRLQVAASYYFNQDATGDRQAVNGELLLQWSRLVLRGEFLWSTFAPASDPDTGEGIEYGSTRRMGWFAEAGVFIINEYLQVAVRYEASRIMEQGTEVEDLNDLWAISGAINGYLLRGRIKLSLEYEHRHEWFDPQVGNDFLALQLQGRI